MTYEKLEYPTIPNFIYLISFCWMLLRIQFLSVQNMTSYFIIKKRKIQYLLGDFIMPVAGRKQILMGKGIASFYTNEHFWCEMYTYFPEKCFRLRTMQLHMIWFPVKKEISFSIVFHHKQLTCVNSGVTIMLLDIPNNGKGIGSGAADSFLTMQISLVILNIRSVILMKQHKFWAWCAVISMIMVLYTGYKHK